MSQNPDAYYNRSEVSNSDLTALKTYYTRCLCRRV